LRPLQQLRGNPRTAHRGKAQVLRVEAFLLGGADQHQQQLRHQDQALRCTGGQTPSKRGTSATGALNAQGFLAGQAQVAPAYSAA
jgi:hypothetical protein